MQRLNADTETEAKNIIIDTITKRRAQQQKGDGTASLAKTPQPTHPSTLFA
jgi:hypothetical protein